MGYRVRGGLPPDSIVEDEAAILKDCVRLIEQVHDPGANAMLRFVLAPVRRFRSRLT